jgi:hypothetical protein
MSEETQHLASVTASDTHRRGTRQPAEDFQILKNLSKVSSYWGVGQHTEATVKQNKHWRVNLFCNDFIIF